MTLGDMGANEWLIVAAAIAGPILAVQAQKMVERWRTESNRRAWIFETLMATRGSRIHIDHVRALNAIDLAYYGKRWHGLGARPKEFQAVLNAWRTYFGHLNQEQHTGPDAQPKVAAWQSAGNELFVNLLAALATANRYEFERDQLKEGGYSPQGYSNFENEQQLVRIGLLHTLSGNRPLPVEVRRPGKPSAPPPATATTA